MGDVALRISTTIYCVDFYFLKQYIVYKIFSATAPLLVVPPLRYRIFFRIIKVLCIFN